MSTWSFHNNCGKNIKFLSAEVKDRNDMKNRVVISSEPMLTGIEYKIQVEEKAEVNGQGRAQICTAFGVCLENSPSLIQQAMCTEIETFVGVNNSGTCVIPIHDSKVQDKPCPDPGVPNIKKLDVKTINESNSLGVMVDERGFLHVCLNGNVKGVVANISTDSRFAVFDLQTSLKSTLSFHAKCGKNIQFRSAEVKDGGDINNRVVFSSEPMLTKMRYEIKVEKKQKLYQEYARFGVCLNDPKTIEVPKTCKDIQSFVGLLILGIRDASGKPGIDQDTGIFKDDAETINSSDRLGVMIDDSGCLHLYLDDRPLHTIRDIKKGAQYFAVFDLNASLKVSTLPLRPMPARNE